MKKSTNKSKKVVQLTKVKTAKKVILTNKVKEVKTNDNELEKLMLLKQAADKAFYAYKALYNKQHNVKGGDLIKEIITLHKKGKTNLEIIEMGYNKHTVSKQISLFKKGVKVEKTTVRQFFIKKAA